MTTSPAVPQDEPRILLVDDDATSLAVLRRTLDGRGFRLFVTRSGEEALEVARRARPLLVLMDVVMPGIDGYEACRRLKSDPQTRDAAVIFLSSLDEARDKVRGLEAGAVDFVTKPFQAEEVVARVNTHLTLAAPAAPARGAQRGPRARAGGGAAAPLRRAQPRGGPARRLEPGGARPARVDRARGGSRRSPCC